MSKTKVRWILGVDKRLDVLEAALSMESLTSSFLTSLLGIKDWQDSKIFGNKSGCISFNQKIDLLIEVGALSKEHRKKYQAFMEIRNQFMHNFEADSYEKCLSHLEGKDTFLLKQYPQPANLSREEQLQGSVNALIKELIQRTIAIIGSIYKNIETKTERNVLKNLQSAFRDAVKELETTLNDYYEKELSKNTTLNSKTLQGLGTQITKMFNQLVEKHFEKIYAEERQRATVEIQVHK